MADKQIFINGVLATREDLDLLNYRILREDLEFTAEADEFGNQYVTTFD